MDNPSQPQKLITHYPNGTKMMEIHMIQGFKHGMFTMWYENGNKMVEGMWFLGKPFGMVKAWNEDGTFKGEISAEEWAVMEKIPHSSD